MSNSKLNNYSRPQIEKIELAWGGVVLCASTSYSTDTYTIETEEDF